LADSQRQSSGEASTGQQQVGGKTSEAVERLLKAIRKNFHPICQLQKTAALRSLLRLVDIPVWASLHGVNWKVRVRLVRHGSYYLMMHTAEAEIVALFAAIDRLFSPHSFWDIGANIGYYSWLMKSRNPAIDIAMFEPDPENLALIAATLERSEAAGIRIRPSAVSDRGGAKPFHVDPVSGATGTMENGRDSFVTRNWGVTSGEIAVSTVTMDDEFAASGSVDLVKIDVEGHEHEVLRGGQQAIQQGQPILIVECFHGGACLTRELRGKGYRLLDAERMTDDIANATNFIALPQRYGDQAKPLLEAWREEQRTWSRGEAAGGGMEHR
jgi:FkbM family methyltransferase